MYNWQFVHCVDFWALVLARGCEDGEEENELRPLIYPLVQIGLGAVGYVYYPPYYFSVSPNYVCTD